MKENIYDTRIKGNYMNLVNIFSVLQRASFSNGSIMVIEGFWKGNLDVIFVPSMSKLL